ncbi:MBL fold metallo-hydrolase [Geotalea uraniireducens]|uniref:Beta-lactamase domain protein n=1 Tax=Geotalea uraniireducens (strain Rf4) TaxID=351605 RepID=A5G655_GEOUR|nr:MBL fold metallo-hydrolase [Geotalea uraniireducens]ABQ27273.1 beta-lactamase domain protein [Geotalea uraniireducens Rf4]
MTSSGCRTDIQGYQVFPLRICYQFMINYCYIILDRFSGEAAIVDPAWDLEALQGKLQEMGARPTMILLTHSHYDHVNLVAPLVREYDPKVILSRQERDYYQFSCDNLFAAEHLDQIRLGETLINCLLTPGHTTGSMCYLLSHSLFTGDTVFVEGCGICTTEGGSASGMFESIQRIKRTVEPHVSVFPGHCYGRAPGCSLASVMEHNIYFHLESKRQFVDFRMRKGQTNSFAFK